MTTRGLVLRNLRHFWRTNLAVIAGVAKALQVTFRAAEPAESAPTMAGATA